MARNPQYLQGNGGNLAEPKGKTKETTKKKKNLKSRNNPQSLLPNVPVGLARLGLKATGEKKQIIINIFTYTLKYNTELGSSAGRAGLGKAWISKTRLGKAWISKNRLGKAQLILSNGNQVCFSLKNQNSIIVIIIIINNNNNKFTGWWLGGASPEAGGYSRGYSSSVSSLGL